MVFSDLLWVQCLYQPLRHVKSLAVASATLLISTVSPIVPVELSLLEVPEE